MNTKPKQKSKLGENKTKTLHYYPANLQGPHSTHMDNYSIPVSTKSPSFNEKTFFTSFSENLTNIPQLMVKKTFENPEKNKKPNLLLNFQRQGESKRCLIGNGKRKTTATQPIS